MEMKEVEIENEKVYLKKDWLGWRVVEPLYLKDAEGKVDWKTWSWKNFLNKKGFVTLGFLLLLLLFLYLGFQEQINNFRAVMNNPCSFCIDCQTQVNSMLKNFTYTPVNKINFSFIINGT